MLKVYNPEEDKYLKGYMNAWGNTGTTYTKESLKAYFENIGPAMVEQVFGQHCEVIAHGEDHENTYVEQVYIWITNISG